MGRRQCATALSRHPERFQQVDTFLALNFKLFDALYQSSFGF